MTNYRFSTTTGVAIVVANMIGTGVFVSLGYQLLDIQSPFVLMMLWLIGGVTALCGALTYAELGANLPRSGGEYHYLSELYHPSLGFVSGWISVTVGFAAPTALVAMTFAAYLSQTLPDVPEKVMATALVVSLAFFHCVSRRTSSMTQIAFTMLKLLFIGLFIGLVLFAAVEPQPISLRPQPGDLSMILSGTFAVALIYVNYAYTGWNAATYIVGEMSEHRRLPIVLFGGTLIVLVVYVLLNFAFLVAAPMSAMAGETEIGVIAAQHAFGEETGSVLSFILALLFVSTVSAMIMAGPRVLQVIGEDFVLFRWLGRTDKSGVPVVAICAQSALAILFIVTASFQSVLLFTGFVLALNTLFAIAGVFLLRRRQRRDRVQTVYRTWGYPLPPLIYITITGWTLCYILLNNPMEGLAGFAIIFTGLLAYVVSRRWGPEDDSGT